MGFKGEYLNKFDEAGRVSLPAKMREELRSSGHNDELVAYFAFHTGCLKVMPKAGFAKIEAHYEANPPSTKGEAQAYKYIFASAVDLEINGSGRITISPKHRAKADLSDECYIIGANNSIEIWNKAAWESELAKIEAEIPDALNSLEGGSLNLSLF